MKQVPNYIPPMQPLIGIIGDCPSEQDASIGEPFRGTAGQFLDNFLVTAGIHRSTCFLGNVCQIHPPKGDLFKFDTDGPEISEGREALRSDLLKCRPNILVLLGRHALWAATGKWNLSDWRGSLQVTSPELLCREDDGFTRTGFKCLASHHPATCQRQYENTPLLLMDLKRAKSESHSPELVLPQRDLRLFPSALEVMDALQEILDKKPTITCDIEGDVAGIQCISMATQPDYSLLVPFIKLDGSPHWPNPSDSQLLHELVEAIMRDPDILKVWQNGQYDRFVWLRHGVEVRGNRDDTMLKFWEWNHELKKSLGFQCSVLTREPFYKADFKSTDQDTFYRYCARDSAVTCEINERLDSLLVPSQRAHYEFNHSLLDPLLYIQNRGFRYNEALAKDRLADISLHVHEWQDKLDIEARALGALPPLLTTIDEVSRIIGRKKKEGVFELVPGKRPDKFKKVRTGSVVKYLTDPPKKEFVPEWPIHKARLETGVLSPSDRGALSMWLGVSMNTKSPIFKTFIYDVLKLPKQWKKDPETKELRLTTDYEALLKLSKDSSHPALVAALELSRLRTRMQYLAMPSLGGRIHCSYNIVGTETGRITCSKSNLYVKSNN